MVLLSWLLFLLFLGFLALLIRITSSSSLKSRSLTLCHRCSSSYFALGLLESTLTLSLASLHNISYLSISTGLELASGTLSLLTLALIVTLPFWMMRIFSRHFTEYDDSLFLSRYRRLSTLLSLKSRYHVWGVTHFYSLFVARRLLFVFVLFFLFEYPLL